MIDRRRYIVVRSRSARGWSAGAYGVDVVLAVLAVTMLALGGALLLAAGVVVLVLALFVLLVLFLLGGNLLLEVDLRFVVGREVTLATIAGIGASLYTVLEDRLVDYTGYLDVRSGYGVEIYGGAALADGQLGSGGASAGSASSGAGGGRAVRVAMVLSLSARRALACWSSAWSCCESSTAS